MTSRVAVLRARHGGYGATGSHWERWMIAAAMTPMETLEVATMYGVRPWLDEDMLRSDDRPLRPGG